MSNRILLIMISVVLALGIVPSALGQQTFFVTPEACVAAPVGSFNYYAPLDTTRLPAWQEKVQHGMAQVVKYDHDTCVRGRTAMGQRIYRAPADTPFFSTDGVNAAADGRCGNEGEVVGHVPKPATAPPAAEPAAAVTAATPAPAVAEQPATAPRAEAEAPFTPAPEITAYVPLSERRVAVTPAAPAPALTTTLAPKKGGRHWAFRFTPLWCVDVRSAKEVYKPISCAAGILAGGYLSGMIGNRGVGAPAVLNGFPAADWNSGPCSLWAVGGPYFGRRPIPARCF